MALLNVHDPTVSDSQIGRLNTSTQERPTQQMTNSESILMSWERARLERIDALPSRKSALIEKLAAQSVTQVVATYSGSGDSGEIDEVRVEPEKTLDGQLARDLEDFLSDIVDLYHSGFEIDSGGGGTITIDVAANSAKLEAYDYVETTEDHDPVAI
jgi:hypothetical protein